MNSEELRHIEEETGIARKDAIALLSRLLIAEYEEAAPLDFLATVLIELSVEKQQHEDNVVNIIQVLCELINVTELRIARLSLVLYPQRAIELAEPGSFALL